MRTSSGGWPDSPALVAEWNELARRRTDSPFLRPGWFRAWYEAFEPRSQLVLLAHRDERLVGVLPLVEHRGVVASATNGHSPHYAPLAEDAVVLAALLDAAMERTRRRLHLNFIDEDDSQLRMLLDHAAERGWRTLDRSYARSPYIELEGTWEEFDARLPSRRRSDMRRRRRKLEETGAVEFETVTEGGGLGEWLREGWEVEASGWKGQEGTAVAADASTLSFYDRIADWAASAGLLRLVFMRLDGKALAFAYCFDDGRSLFVLKIGFDPEYGKFAPGVLMTRHMVEGAIDSGLRFYEFLGNDDPYKLVWTDRIHDRRLVQVFPRTPIGMTEHLAWAQGRPLAKRLLRR